MSVSVVDKLVIDSTTRPVVLDIGSVSPGQLFRQSGQWLDGHVFDFDMSMVLGRLSLILSRQFIARQTRLVWDRLLNFLTCM